MEKVKRMTVTELSEAYGISPRTIRARIKRFDFHLTAVRKPNGIFEYAVTKDFIEKVLRLDPRYKNLRNSGKNVLRLPVKCVDVKLEPSCRVEDDVAVTLVFNGTDVKKMVDFLRSFGEK